MPRRVGRVGESGGATVVPAARLTLRPIGPTDRDLLLGWANDPATRAASFHPAPIDPATHAAWFERRLGERDGRIWIGLVDGRPVGQVRVDRVAPGRGEVGISVAPEARGRGIARLLLRAGIDAAAGELDVGTLLALVRPENVASMRLFSSAGFRPAGEDVRAGVACRILVLRTRDEQPVTGSPASA